MALEAQISEECFKTVDVLLDLGRDFAVLKGMIMAGKDEKEMENVFGDLSLVEDYAFSEQIISAEERIVSRYHKDKIKRLLGNRYGAMKAADEAVVWAGRTFAEKVVACECVKRS
jgi:hypothetical protein